jgi:hypothetical protein
MSLLATVLQADPVKVMINEINHSYAQLETSQKYIYWLVGILAVVIGWIFVYTLTNTDKKFLKGEERDNDIDKRFDVFMEKMNEYISEQRTERKTNELQFKQVMIAVAENKNDIKEVDKKVSAIELNCANNNHTRPRNK